MKTQLGESEVSRFWQRVQRGPGCWLWSGETNNHGYGRFVTWRGGRKRHLAHRVSYALTFGDAPNGSVIRHTCDTPKCVRPSHLLLGTQADNIRDAIERGRADLTGLALGWARKQTHCKRGHEFTPENTLRRPHGRVCRACNRMHQAAYLERKRKGAS